MLYRNIYFNRRACRTALPPFYFSMGTPGISATESYVSKVWLTNSTAMFASLSTEVSSNDVSINYDVFPNLK